MNYSKIENYVLSLNDYECALLGGYFCNSNSYYMEIFNLLLCKYNINYDFLKQFLYNSKEIYIILSNQYFNSECIIEINKIFYNKLKKGMNLEKLRNNMLLKEIL